MKKLVALSALLPGTALAHGGHPPVPAAAHDAAHTAPVLLIAVAVIGLVALLMRNRS